MDGHYAMVFTCKKCKSRSVRKISKQGYHKGTVLITCPGCNNRHVVADHLKIFTERPQTIEDILAERGESIRKVSLNNENDWEFMADGSIVSRTAKGSPRVLDENGNMHDVEALERILESHGIRTDQSRSVAASGALGRVGHDSGDGVPSDGTEYVGDDGHDGREHLDDESWHSVDEHDLPTPRRR
ncbi:MAG: hypothetical protein M1815_005568 [Lichina confinis]|nr:MAG: hypothetical protein M1815_005568 [Lichina confinis]